LSAVAQRDVEEAVRAEGDGAAVVVLVRVVGRDPDALLAPGVGLAWVGLGDLEPRDDRPAAVGRRVLGRVVDEELAVLLVPGVEGQAQHPLLVAPVDLVGQLEEQFLVGGRGVVRE